LVMCSRSIAAMAPGYTDTTFSRQVVLTTTRSYA
jgi:hypothetical protein